MSNKLDQAKSDYIEKLKKVKLAEAGIDDYNDLDVYVKYISAESEKEIEKEAQAIVADVKQQNKNFADAYIDKRVWKPF